MEEREGKIRIPEQDPQKVIIIDNGEGETPNHDKVIIVYPKS